MCCSVRKSTFCWRGRRFPEGVLVGNAREGGCHLTAALLQLLLSTVGLEDSKSSFCHGAGNRVKCKCWNFLRISKGGAWGSEVLQWQVFPLPASAVWGGATVWESCWAVVAFDCTKRCSCPTSHYRSGRWRLKPGSLAGSTVGPHLGCC